MMLSVTVLVLGILAANCSGLQDNEILGEVTEALLRMEARVSEIEINRHEDIQKMTEAMKAMEAKRNEDIKKMTEAMKQMEAKRNEDIHKITVTMQQMEGKMEDNMYELNTTMNRLVADNQQLKSKADEFEKHQGKE